MLAMVRAAQAKTDRATFYYGEVQGDGSSSADNESGMADERDTRRREKRGGGGGRRRGDEEAIGRVK